MTKSSTKLSLKDFLLRSRAAQTVPLGFSVGSGITFFYCLLYEEHVLGNLDRRLTFTALIASLWIGAACGALAFLIGAFFDRNQARIDK